ncbi:peptide chain release factor 2 [Batrachochytrium salamandrivorans]|nr:peptide chain release factor 2 [Batrachochytrium salamandrivorans]
MLRLLRCGPRYLATAAEESLAKTRNIQACEHSLKVLRESLNWASPARLEAVTQELDSRPEIWTQDARLAKRLSREQKTIRERLAILKEMEHTLQGTLELVQLAEEEKDAELAADCAREFRQLVVRSKSIETESLLGGPADHMGCYVEISAGSGGTEAQDFAGMLLKMYTNWASNVAGMETMVKEMTEGGEVGIRNCVLQIASPYAYGWLRGEQGAHRICRVSPYDKEQRRHTSFAQVAVLPFAIGDEDDDAAGEDDSELMKESDLRIDTFRASGPGGQGVNTTSSAVRVVHIPTGLTVSSQGERSQHRNKATAMSLLKGKLLAQKLRQKAEEKARIRSLLPEASFGSQVRSYYWSPQKFVKDHRSGYESFDVDSILDGSRVHEYMEAYLQWDSRRMS